VSAAELEGLEDEADPSPAEVGQLVVGERPHLLASKL
jgi:hypothetical protein